MKRFNIKGVTVATWVRISVLLLALVNQFLTITGNSVLPFSDEEVEKFVTFIFTGVTAVIALWKNNSFTRAAQDADKMMKAEKEKSLLNNEN
ncbi:phage holin [Listeria grandensis]|uniref:Phage holin n=1 Tax=Listeria grandensis TaxID=1494963 RepID=A0A7X0Y2R1_9LIST|nr:phage holin [Listeria grandensis]MBC1474692.1 phage holin [Listeria grandensis]MBC1935819.1 phage holin [Listeria grandensis]